MKKDCVPTLYNSVKAADQRPSLKLQPIRLLILLGLPLAFACFPFFPWLFFAASRKLLASWYWSRNTLPRLRDILSRPVRCGVEIHLAAVDPHQLEHAIFIMVAVRSECRAALSIGC